MHQKGEPFKTFEKKESPCCIVLPSVSQPPTFRMPKWWPELVKGEAAFNTSGDVTCLSSKELDQHGPISLPSGSLTSPSSDNCIPVSLRVPPTFSALRAEGHVAQPIDKTCIALSTRSVPENEFILEIPPIDSQDRLWKWSKYYKRAPLEGENHVPNVQRGI